MMDRSEIMEGIRGGLPICLGYVSVAFAFGMMAKSNGLPTWVAVFISMSNVTSAGQLAGLNLIVASGTYLEIAMTTLIINLRYSLMSLSLSQRFDEKLSLPKRAMIAFGVTDEIFAVAIQRKKTPTPLYFSGLILVPYFGWALGTFLGAVASDLMSAQVASALGIAIYAMFIAIIIPSCKEVKAIRYVLVIAITMSVFFRYMPLLKEISTGWVIILITLVAASLAAYKYPVAMENEDE